MTVIPFPGPEFGIGIRLDPGQLLLGQDDFPISVRKEVLKGFPERMDIGELRQVILEVGDAGADRFDSGSRQFAAWNGKHPGKRVDIHVVHQRAVNHQPVA